MFNEEGSKLANKNIPFCGGPVYAQIRNICRFRLVSAAYFSLEYMSLIWASKYAFSCGRLFFIVGVSRSSSKVKAFGVMKISRTCKYHQ